MPRAKAAPTERVDLNVPIAELIPYPGNPRRGDVEKIKESMRENGWAGAVVRQASTGYMLIGNHRTRAWGELGHEHVPIVHTIDVDDATARRLVLADNRTTDVASYDHEALIDIIRAAAAEEERGLVGSGYEDADVALWLKQIDQQASAEGIQAREGSKRTMEERMTGDDGQTPYDEQDVRNIVLPVKSDVFTELIEQMTVLAEKWDLDTNAQVVVRAVREAFLAAS